MEKTSLWNDAAKYGAVLGAAAIVVDVLRMYITTPLLTLVWLVGYVFLIYYFTCRRVQLSGDDEMGVNYGRRLWYIVCMMLFAGFLEGVFMMLSANWLFVDKYNESLSQTILLLEGSGFYTSEMLEHLVSMMHSPITLIAGSIGGSAFKGLFFGLFVAALTKQDQDIFMDEDPKSDE